MERLIGVRWSIKDVAESDISMVDVVFSEFSISLNDFHPNIHDLRFTPSIFLRLSAVLHDV